MPLPELEIRLSGFITLYESVCCTFVAFLFGTISLVNKYGANRAGNAKAVRETAQRKADAGKTK